MPDLTCLHIEAIHERQIDTNKINLNVNRSLNLSYSVQCDNCVKVLTHNLY